MRWLACVILICILMLPARAARSLDGAGDFLKRSSAVVTTMPLTIALWIKCTSFATAPAVMSIGVDGSNNQRWTISSNTTGSIVARSRTTANADATTTANAGTGAWHHVCAVFTSSTSRAIFLDGANKGTNATSNSPAGMNATYLGNNMGLGGDFPGDMAEAAVWNVALTDDEVAALGKGVAPLNVRPAALVSYWPLMGRTSPEIDVRSGADLDGDECGAIASPKGCLLGVQGGISRALKAL